MKTIFVSDQIHRRLKVLSAQRGTTLQELADLLLTQSLTTLENISPMMERRLESRPTEIRVAEG